MHYVEHDLHGIFCYMGEALEILKGFEDVEMSVEQTRRLAKRGSEYLTKARSRLEEIRGELLGHKAPPFVST